MVTKLLFGRILANVILIQELMSHIMLCSISTKTPHINQRLHSMGAWSRSILVDWKSQCVQLNKVICARDPSSLCRDSMKSRMAESTNYVWTFLCCLLHQIHLCWCLYRLLNQKGWTMSTNTCSSCNNQTSDIVYLRKSFKCIPHFPWRIKGGHKWSQNTY